MSQSFLRPPIETLVFRLYDRPLHPELFDTLAFRRVRNRDFTLSVRITPTGHVVEWRGERGTLTEVTCASEDPLPEQGQHLQLRFDGERRGRWEPGHGLHYQVGLQTEVLPPEVFLHVHDELANDGAKRGLLFHFRPSFRLGLSPLGFVAAEQLPTGLSISSFHTFPEEFAVLKTQSLIEIV
jgi:hypothetical protein